MTLPQAIARVIRTIPHGKVSTYGAIARAAGSPGAARQVVATLRKTPGLPWHRVLGAGGSIRLPGESGLEQRFRLEQEGVRFRGRRVDMAEFEHSFSARRKAARPPVKKAQVRKKSDR
ncbi:MAG: MGMT family protein [Acidobacteriales bacterium]|nr:MGMT family protein [Terriglobales bacterium]